MEHVKVPIVRGETLLLQAIGILKDKDRSGLIVDLPDRPRVLFLDELLRILCDKDGGNVKIDQVRPRYRAVRLPPIGATNPPEAIRRGREATVSSSAAQFAVLDILEGQAQVVATSEPPVRSMLIRLTPKPTIGSAGVKTRCPRCPLPSCLARICHFRVLCPSSNACFLTIRRALLTLKPSAGAMGLSADGAANPANPTASPIGRTFCGAATVSGITR